MKETLESLEKVTDAVLIPNMGMVSLTIDGLERDLYLSYETAFEIASGKLKVEDIVDEIRRSTQG